MTTTQIALYQLLSILKANRCPPVPYIQHAHYDGSDTSEGITVEYECQHGYVTRSLTRRFNISCVSTVWELSAMESCEGKLNASVPDIYTNEGIVTLCCCI